MRRRRVVFATRARDDLLDLFDWIAGRAGSDVAHGYLDRLERFCRDLELASERGQLRDDVAPGLRIVGFERRVTVAFRVLPDHVVIVALHYGGRNWDRSN